MRLIFLDALSHSTVENTTLIRILLRICFGEAFFIMHQPRLSQEKKRASLPASLCNMDKSLILSSRKWMCMRN